MYIYYIYLFLFISSSHHLSCKTYKSIPFSYKSIIFKYTLDVEATF